jgi:acyl-CoA thioester hydrolase
MGAEYMQANNAGSFALESHVRYLSEVRAGQRVTLRSRALARSEKRLHFMHFMMIDESSSLAATCEFVGAHIDMTARRMSPLAGQVAASYDRLLAEHRQIDWEAPICGSMRP